MSPEEGAPGRAHGSPEPALVACPLLRQGTQAPFPWTLSPTHTLVYILQGLGEEVLGDPPWAAPGLDVTADPLGWQGPFSCSPPQVPEIQGCWGPPCGAGAALGEPSSVCVAGEGGCSCVWLCRASQHMSEQEIRRGPYAGCYK